MKVVIVAKTRQGSAACVGGITFEGRSVRLLAADAAHADHAGMEYTLGDVWEVEGSPPHELIPPHVENLIVTHKRRLGQMSSLPVFIERHMPPYIGPVAGLCDGLLQHTPSGALYIAAASGLPGYSTFFWRPDQALVREDTARRIRYRYPTPDEGRTLTFVGFQEPLPQIAAGALVRVSLAHWWRAEDSPVEELRCYVQLSGWFEAPAGDTRRLFAGASLPTATAPAPANAISSTDPAAHPAVAAPTSVTKCAPHAHTRPTGTPDLTQARRLLKRVFGHDEFRPFQVDLIGHVLQRRDALGIIPTGGGKSLCYQLPALLFDGLTVVVSPLISLMQDQVDQLRELGVPAVCLNSTLSVQEYVATTARLRRGEVRLLYTSPETLLRPETLVLLDACRVACFTIDEAHCISAWGHDFRPEYRQLLPVRQRYAQAVCLALTATAAPRVQQDIMEILGFTEDNTVIAGFDRPNLFLAAQPRTDGLAQTVAFLRQHRAQSGIIYCSTRRQVDELTAKLSAHKFSVLPYHAGLDDATRRDNQQRFVRDEVPVMVATVAFGMGINKSNVRFILHHNLPENLESYYQQIGRAGRDGLPSDCLLLYGSQDISTIWRFIDGGAESQRPGAQARLQAMVRFAESRACRRVPLLRYFGEAPAAETCPMCDNCRRGADNRPRTDVSEAARQFLTVVQQTGQVFGAVHVINVLRGSRSQGIQRRQHDRLPSYGQGRDYSTEVWRRLAQQFIAQGLLEQDMRIGSLRLTEAGRSVLNGGQVLAHLESGVLAAAAEAPQGADEHDAGLFQALRGTRQQLAAAAGVPPYVVFSDRTLVEMATYFPHTPADLLAIEGVGEVKLARYGEAFLNVIRPYCAAHGLQPHPRPSATPRAGVVSHTGTRRFVEVGQLFAGGHSIPELQAMYGIQRGTIIEHLAAYVRAGHTIDSTRLYSASHLSPARQADVLRTIAELGPDRLRPVFDALGGSVPWDELHLLRLIYLTGAADAMDGPSNFQPPTSNP